MIRKQTKCRIKADGCEILYTKRSITQKCCHNPLCAIELMQREKAQKARKQHLADKVSLRSRSEWVKLAQSVFNAFIRKRDMNQKCICCDKSLTIESVGGGFDCGHYRSVGSAPHLRFNENNAHGQSKQCNRWGSGRAVDYRIGLIKRIGLHEVEKLESDNSVKKYTIPELQEIIATYKTKLKELTRDL